MARIPDNLIDEIRASTDIVDLVSDFVTLRKAGRNYLGLCPFHNENTPSFSVNPERQIFHCFGCGKGGNVFTFLMEHEQVSFVEAVRTLAQRSNIVIPEARNGQDANSETEILARVTAFAAQYFHDQLVNSSEKSKVRRYIAERGLSEETVKTFRLGYAPDAWDGLLSAARKANIGPEWLMKAGLAKTGSQRAYDTFRQRLIFPIHTASGRVVGFGGRSFADDVQPKYLNSPETAIYRKSRVLYGLYHTREALRKRGKVLVVEGYMDLIGLHQQGVDSVVAVCGTALTPEQARLMVRYAQQAILVYDSDPAGVRATWRAIEPLVESGLWTRIAQLPEGEDPDSFVQEHGADEFMRRVQQSESFVDFMGSHSDMNNPVDREEVFRTLSKLIRSTPNLVHREQYREEAERRFPALQNLLASELRATGNVRARQQQPVQEQTEKKTDNRDSMVERALVQLMLNSEDIAEFVEKQLEPHDFKDALYREIVECCFESMNQGSALEPTKLIDKIENEAVTQAIAELTNSSDSGDHLEERARDHVVRIKQNRLRESMTRLMQQIKQMEQDGRSSDLDETMAIYMELKEQEKSLLQTARAV